MMQKFRESRRPSARKQQSQKVEKLSPEKFGKSAFDDLYYTPSKPGETTGVMRKSEDAALKLREVEAAYKLLEDKYNKIQKEKGGLQESLSKQIEMYKQLIEEMQQKAEARLKQAQNAFKNELQDLFAAKQEQAKFAQSEKQNLQKLLDQLEQIGEELEQKLNTANTELKETTTKLDNANEESTRLRQKVQAGKQNLKVTQQKLQNTIEGLKQRVMDTEREWRNRMDEAVAEKNKQIKMVEKQHKQQINAINSEKQHEQHQKDIQIKGMLEKFDNETKKMNETISSKDRKIEMLTKDIHQLKESMSNSSRGYEQEIISLANQKSRLFEEVDSLNEQNTRLSVLVKDLQLTNNQEKNNLETYILKLKEDIGYSQANFLRERDRNCLNFEDSTKELGVYKKQMLVLKNENEELRQKLVNHELLVAEVKRLRDTLMDSSYELQRCKQEFIRIGQQRDLLAIKLEEASSENNSLRRIKNTREQEARSWRDTYYLSRSRRR